MHGRPRHVRISVEEFTNAPGVSLEAWGLLLWIGRFRAERWPSNVVRVADLAACGANIRRLRRLLAELWNAGLVMLIDDDLDAQAYLLADDDERASKLMEEIDQRCLSLEIGQTWRIICEMLAEDSPNLAAIERARQLNAERQRRFRFRKKLRSTAQMKLGFRLDDNARYVTPLNVEVDPPKPPRGPAEIAPPGGGSDSVACGDGRQPGTGFPTQNRPEKSLEGGGSLYPPSEIENAAPRGNGEPSVMLNGAGAVLDALLRN